MDRIWLKAYPRDLPAEIDPSQLLSLRQLLEGQAVALGVDQPAESNHRHADF
jgi:hypothetical protein